MKLLMRTFTTPKSATPLESTRSNVNVCAVPDGAAALAGYKITAAMDAGGYGSTPQVPRACHPEFAAVLLPADVYTTLLPQKLALNEMASVRVSVLPLPETKLPVLLMVHWPLLM